MANLGIEVSVVALEAGCEELDTKITGESAWKHLRRFLLKKIPMELKSSETRIEIHPSNLLIWPSKGEALVKGGAIGLSVTEGRVALP